MNVRVVPGWIIEEAADGSERRVPLGDLLMVDLEPEESGSGWIVTVYLKGEEEGLAWLLEDEEAAHAFVDELALAHDACPVPETGWQLLRQLWLDELDDLLEGKLTVLHWAARTH